MTTVQRDKFMFNHLLNKHKITMIRLAKHVGLPLAVLHALLMGKPVSADHAHKILAGLSQLAGTTYTIRDVCIALEPIGSAITSQEIMSQYPTQATRVIHQPTRIQSKKSRIKTWLFGLLLGGGVQWGESY